MSFKPQRVSIVASTPPMILSAVMFGLYLWGSPTSYESPGLLLALNFVFTTLVSVFIAILAGRSFLMNANPALLAICVGMTVWGVSAFVAVVGEHVGNYNITIHNLGVATSGLCHLAGAFAVYRYGKRAMPEPGAWLSLGVAAGLCTVGLIWMGTLENWLPPFFIQGSGGTALRTCILVISIALFSLSSILTCAHYLISGRPFFHWYCLGLSLIAAGAMGLILQPTHGCALGWIARITQYIGGVYMLVGTILAMREAGGWRFSLEERLSRSEQALRDQAELIRNVNDNTSELIFMKDRHGNLTYANAATLRLVGQPALTVGTRDQELFENRSEHQAIAANDQQVMETGQCIEAEEIYTGSDGRCRTFLSTKSPLRDNSGQIIGVIGVSRDITERAAMEDELRRAKKEAEAASLALREADYRKDQFLAILAHELRNPLAPVRNAVEILRLKGPNIPELDWARDVIDRQMRHMTRLIDELMDVSRIRCDKIELKREQVELAEILQMALEASRPLIEQYGHQLIVNVPPSIYLNADLNRLAQVFCNLLNNAAKYTDPGGQISLTAEQRNEEVMVSIHDNGIGISNEMMANVFELFVQVDNSLEKSRGGLGIGLTLAKRLVEMHGGGIEVQSAGLGCGSTFLVRLPVLKIPDSAAAIHDGDSSQLMNSVPCRILIVDDNRDAADSLGMLMQAVGYEVQKAYDGAEAVRIAGVFQPQVALLDIGMPKLNGYDTARAIRKESWGRNLVLFAMTGWGQDEDRHKSQAAGFDQHLVKPVDPHDLMERLASLEIVTAASTAKE